MKYSVKATATEREFKLVGDFSAADEGIFFDIFMQIRRQPEPQTVFELSECSSVDAAAAGMLIVACEEAAKRNLIRVLRNVPENIREFLVTSGLGAYYPFQDSEKRT